jgi:N6-adenosine-specific RNA methylase IME4
MKYRTIVADPPWPIADPRSRPWCRRGGRRRRDTFLPYDLMTIADIQRLPVSDLAEPDAHLFLWVTATFNAMGYGVQVAGAWGFERVAEFVWEKPNFGMGAFPRPTHEILMVCCRGALPFNGPRNVRSVQKWRIEYTNNGGKAHSQKPEAAMDLIEQVSPGPYVELFSRRHRLGWDVWGNGSANTAQWPVPA